MPQQRLDNASIGATFKWEGGKGVSKRMERYALADSGSIGRLMEQAVELACGPCGSWTARPE